MDAQNGYGVLFGEWKWQFMRGHALTQWEDWFVEAVRWLSKEKAAAVLASRRASCGALAALFAGIPERSAGSAVARFVRADGDHAIGVRVGFFLFSWGLA